MAARLFARASCVSAGVCPRTKILAERWKNRQSLWRPQFDVFLPAGGSVRGEMSGPLAEVLIEKFPWLFDEFGFKITYQDFSPKYFGNSVVELLSDTLMIRFICDRGQYWIDVRLISAPEKWCPMIFVLEAAGIPCSEPNFDLDVAAARFREHYLTLVAAMGANLEETRRELNRLAEQRMQALRRPRTPGC